MVAQRLIAVSHWPALIRFVRTCRVLPLQLKTQVVGAIDCDIEGQDIGACSVILKRTPEVNQFRAFENNLEFVGSTQAVRHAPVYPIGGEVAL
eukprot:3263126-Rhodomonas_salina.1